MKRNDSSIPFLLPHRHHLTSFRIRWPEYHGFGRTFDPIVANFREDGFNQSSGCESWRMHTIHTPYTQFLGVPNKQTKQASKHGNTTGISIELFAGRPPPSSPGFPWRSNRRCLNVPPWPDFNLFGDGNHRRPDLFRTDDSHPNPCGWGEIAIYP